MNNITFNNVSTITLTTAQEKRLEKLIKRINKMVGITTDPSLAVCRTTVHDDTMVQVIINQDCQPDILFRLTGDNDLVIDVTSATYEYVLCNGVLKRLLFQQSVVNFLAGVCPPAVAA